MLCGLSRSLTYLNTILYIPITLAAFRRIDLFDFAGRPGGLAYFAAYLAVAIILLFESRTSGTGLGD